MRVPRQDGLSHCHCSSEGVLGGGGVQSQEYSHVLCARESILSRWKACSAHFSSTGKSRIRGSPGNLCKPSYTSVREIKT